MARESSGPTSLIQIFLNFYFFYLFQKFCVAVFFTKSYTVITKNIYKFWSKLLHQFFGKK